MKSWEYQKTSGFVPQERLLNTQTFTNLHSCTNIFSQEGIFAHTCVYVNLKGGRERDIHVERRNSRTCWHQCTNRRVIHTSLMYALSHLLIKIHTSFAHMSTPSSKEKYSSCRLFFLERAKSRNNENTVNPSTPRHPLPVSPAFTHMLPARLIPPTSPTTQKLLAPYSRWILWTPCEPLQLNQLEGNCHVNRGVSLQLAPALPQQMNPGAETQFYPDLETSPLPCKAITVQWDWAKENPRLDPNFTSAWCPN